MPQTQNATLSLGLPEPMIQPSVPVLAWMAFVTTPLPLHHYPHSNLCQTVNILRAGMVADSSLYSFETRPDNTWQNYSEVQLLKNVQIDSKVIKTKAVEKKMGPYVETSDFQKIKHILYAQQLHS